MDNIKFGSEYIDIDSWSRKRQYDCLCQALGPGMNTHLQENELVREIFGLGPPIPLGKPVTKLSKQERVSSFFVCDLRSVGWVVIGEFQHPV